MRNAGVRSNTLLERDLQIPRKILAGALRPLDQPDLVGFRGFQAKLLQLAGIAQAVEVDVAQHQIADRIVLHQSEARARHLDRSTGARPDQGAGKLALAGA